MNETRLRDYFIEILFWLLEFVANTEKLVRLDFYTSCVIMLGIMLGVILLSLNAKINTETNRVI